MDEFKKQSNSKKEEVLIKVVILITEDLSLFPIVW